MTNPGSVASGTDCLLRRQKGLVWAPVCCHPRLSDACGSNPTGLHPVPMASGASPSPWGSSPLEKWRKRVGVSGKGGMKFGDTPNSCALRVLGSLMTADSVPVYWLHGCVPGMPQGHGKRGTHGTLGSPSTFLHPAAGFRLCHLSSVICM